MTEFEEEVYRALLRGEVVAADGGADVVGAAIARLVELGLVRLDGDGHAVVVEPEVGITRLIRRRMREANAELRRICGAWEALPVLTAEGRGSGSHDDIVRIEDADEVDERIWSLSLDAGEVLAMHQPRRVRVEVLPGLLRRLGEGVRWRTIIAREHLKDAEMAEYCMRLHRGGDWHRVTDGVVQELVIVDRLVAFVAAVPDGHRSGALMIRQPGVVATLVALFERVWEHATDLESEASSELTARERQILCLLTTVAKDEIAAREMDMSLRSYRRHVADLLTRLGAANRVQAAVLAQQRGWI
ncbi:helix-turn-helix transcriptional regulator [Streptosporangium sp. G11]|uniref:helix-turn-helix transcriptional regulator n=1 Tax=Streptosporangium sp. G11 TaxID=3436926 RepID=UPI003EBD235A